MIAETALTQKHDRGNGNICIECGLCCDGSMFGKAIISKHDDPTFLRQTGVEFIEVGDNTKLRSKCYVHHAVIASRPSVCVAIYNNPRLLRFARNDPFMFLEGRRLVRNLFPEKRFFEIHVQCNMETCKKRDPHGLYQKALAGEIAEFTGISSPYEAPPNPEIVVDTEVHDAEQIADFLLRRLVQENIIP